MRWSSISSTMVSNLVVNYVYQEQIIWLLRRCFVCTFLKWKKTAKNKSYFSSSLFLLTLHVSEWTYTLYILINTIHKNVQIDVIGVEIRISSLTLWIWKTILHLRTHETFLTIRKFSLKYKSLFISVYNCLWFEIRGTLPGNFWK